MIRHSARDQILINKLTEITLANLGDENFGVKELAREAGISRYRLGKKLHELKNRTINQFITEIRLQRAFEMLRDEDLTASEVAYKVGYGSATSFNTVF